MPSLFSKYRFTVNDGTGDTAVTPIVSGLKRRWELEGGTRAYRVKIPTKFVFGGADYVYFKALYDAGECDTVSILIEEKCEGVWSEWFSGIVPIFIGDYDIDRCRVSFEVKPNDVYECASKAFGVKRNWLEYADAVAVKAIYGTVKTTTCVDSATTWPAPDFILHFYKGCWGSGHTSSPDPDPSLAWRPISHDQYFVFLPGPEIWKLHTTTTWAREEVTSVGTPPGMGWINISGTTWARPVSVGFPIVGNSSLPYGRTWETQVLNASELSNGRNLSDVLTAVLLDMECDFDGVVSDFFNINPDATAPSNDAYDYAAENMADLFIFQKSDIVRAAASNDATRFEITMKEFLEELSIFNVFYAITNVAGVKTLRIEHYTYFDGANGLDLTTYGGGRYIVGKQSFGAEKDVPAFESFSYQEAYRPKFLRQRIDYPGSCATSEGNDRTANLMCTDFGGLLENPDAGLSGFFLLSTVDIGSGEYLVNTLNGEPNGCFAWENLMPALLADGRYHADATATVPGYVVSSVRKNRTTPDITIKMCCDLSFSPSELVNTELGWGEVKDAEQDTETGTLKLTLLQ
jgi:hypothetical protein